MTKNIARRKNLKNIYIQSRNYANKKIKKQ